MPRQPRHLRSSRLHLESLEDRTVPSSPPVRWSFDGPLLQTSNPPSPSIAIGTTHTVYVAKDQIEWRTVPSPTGGGSAGGLTNRSFNTFFASVSPPATAVFTSPRVIYDQVANRFVVGVIENVDQGGTTTSRLLMAVSATSSPTGTWHIQARQNLLNIGGSDTYSSQMGLAVDEEAVYVTTSQSRFSDDVYVDARVRIIDKGINTSGWYAGGTPVFTQMLDPDTSATNQSRYEGLAPAHVYGTPPTGTVGTYLVAYNGAQSGTGANESVQVVRIDNPLNDATRSFTATMIDVTNIDSGGALPDAAQPGSAVLIDTGDRRVGNAVWRNNALYFGSTINPASGSDVGEATAHWFKVNTTGNTLADQGNVDSSVSTNMATFMPGVAVDLNGNLGVSFAGVGNVGGDPESLGAFYAARLATDPAGSLRSYVELIGAIDPYVERTGGVSLWGPYTALTVDPTGQIFWNYGIYAGNPETSGTDPGRWSSRASSFSFNWPPDLENALSDTLQFEDVPPFTLPSFDFNFEDFDGPDSGLTYSVVSNNNLGLGTPSFPSRNSMLFSPTLNANGTADIRIRATDLGGAFSEDTLAVTLIPIEDSPIAVDDAYVTDEEVTLSVDSFSGLLANDTEPDGQTMEAFKETNPTKGTVTVRVDGSFVYVPRVNATGADSFTYRAVDSAGTFSIAAVNITINPINDAPQAVDDPDVSVTYETAEDTQLTISAPGVLENDVDADGDELQAIIVTGPLHAEAFTLFADGSFTYTPEDNYPVTANFSGTFTDTFTYKVNDGTVDSATTATVTITVIPVDDVPVANNDTYNVNEDDVFNLPATGILSNDNEFDGQPLTLTKLTDPLNGVLTLVADGSLTYDPNDNFFGTDSFTYKVSDGTTDSGVATVTFNVLAVNDNPVANGDGTYSIAEDTLLTVAAAGILANDTDVDPDTLTVDIVSPPAHFLTFNANANGSFDYQAAANYYGADSFTYRVFDGTSYSNTVTVTLAVTPVQDAVVATDDSASTGGKPIKISVLSNDVDPDRDPLRVLSYTKPAFGRVTRSGSALVYTPNKGATGIDTFTYVVTDNRGNKDTGEVQVTITDSLAPTVKNIRVHYGPTRYIDLPTTRSVLPWAGITKISVVFSENIQSGPLAGALTLTSFNGSNLPLTFDSFDASTRTATWNLSSAIGIDRVSLKLDRTDVLASKEMSWRKTPVETSLFCRAILTATASSTTPT